MPMIQEHLLTEFVDLKNRGSPWRDLPSEYSQFSSVHKRYKHWYEKGHWEAIFKAFAEEADFSC